MPLTSRYFNRAPAKSRCATAGKTGKNGSSDQPVLVTGGAGYIGSAVCAELLRRHRRVRLLDNLLYGDAGIAELRSDRRIEMVAGDCRDASIARDAMDGVKQVVHLAAIVGDPACDLDPQTAVDLNQATTASLIRLAGERGVASFVFASTCSVYGASKALLTESDQVVPLSLYARTKVQAEETLLRSRSTTFHPTSLRIATVFGLSRRPRFDLVVNYLTAKALEEGLITIYNGSQWRPFIHVSDVARAICDVLAAPVESVSGEVLNCGDSRYNFTLSEVSDKIRAMLPTTRVEHVENADQRNYRVCFDKIRRVTGFECTVPLEEGIAEIACALEKGALGSYTDERYHNATFIRRRLRASELMSESQAAGLGAANRNKTVMRAAASATS